MNRIYKIWQYMSMDVALGSVGSSVLAVNVLHIRLQYTYWFILPLCVWIIYTADHLLDAWKVKEQAIMGRHYFHYVHRKAIGYILCLAVIVCFFLILYQLSKPMIIFGLILFFLVAIYLLTNNFNRSFFRTIPKELFITMGYIAGTWGIPILSRGSMVSRSEILVCINYFLIILTIPILYSIYEFDADKAGGFVSFATTFGVKTSEFLVQTALILSTILSAIAFIQLHHAYCLIMISMTLPLFVVLYYRKMLILNEKYRAICDSICCFPFLLWI